MLRNVSGDGKQDGQGQVAIGHEFMCPGGNVEFFLHHFQSKNGQDGQADEDEQRVHVRSPGEIEMKKGMQGPGGAASGAVQTGELVKHARGEKLPIVRVEPGKAQQEDRASCQQYVLLVPEHHEVQSVAANGNAAPKIKKITR